jgi:hypothetical protein
MPTKKAHSRKRLHRGIKIEAKKALKGAKVPAPAPAPTVPYVQFKMNEVYVSSS